MFDRLKNRIRLLKRYAASVMILRINRALGRSFVPDPKFRLFVEPVSFCNLECKFCSYPKNLRTRTVMSDDLFTKCIAEAGAMGFRTIALTPITGDVFMDKQFIDRLRAIDASGVRDQAFYTNFIGANADTIRQIFALRKLSFMEISLYGHDLASFKNITGREKVQFDRLVANLGVLQDHYSSKPPGLEIVISFRTYRSFDFATAPSNPLIDKVRALAAIGIKVGQSSTVDNWGGDVDETDIADIDMDLTDGQRLYKNGACGLPFDSVQVTATGEVNACACRDPRGSLKIGDLKTDSLAAILSTRNDKWLGIIADHERGRFNDVCRKCGFYQSIYDSRRQSRGAMIGKDEYFERLRAAEAKQA